MRKLRGDDLGYLVFGDNQLTRAEENRQKRKKNYERWLSSHVPKPKVVNGEYHLKHGEL